MTYKINSNKLNFRDLNKKIDEAIAKGSKKIELENVHGQYYIGRGIADKDVSININGIPGNDLGVFMGKKGIGPSIFLSSDGQDNIANTMNGGKIVVNGNAGNVLGYGMRGGKVFVKGDVGQRTGIHMKSTLEFAPTIIVGGCAGNFTGEYMAGGTLIILGLTKNKHKPIIGNFIGTGMHGGVMFIREKEISEFKLGNDSYAAKMDTEDYKFLENNLDEFVSDLKLDYKQILAHDFTKILPKGTSPYKKMYVRIHKYS